MDQEIIGVVLRVTKQWWLKINRKPVRTHFGDGAEFPYVIKVRYTVAKKDYVKRKWIAPGQAVPVEGSFVRVRYCRENPRKAKVL